MLSKEIKDNFVQNDNFLEELKEKISLLENQIRDNISVIKSTKEYNDYKKDNSDYNLDYLSKLDIVSSTCLLKQKLDRLNNLLNNELNKISSDEYDLIIKRCNCEHLFYQDEEEGKKCVKCGYSDNLRNLHTSLKEFLSSQLYIELDSNKDKENDIVLPTLISNEPYDYIVSIVSEVNGEINNMDLAHIICKKVAENNITLIESIYLDTDQMDAETKKNYMIYKKILEFDSKNKKK